MYAITRDLVRNNCTYKCNSYDRIGILLDRNRAMLSAIYNAFQNYITYVPVDPSLPDERINRLVADSQLDCVITSKKYKSRVKNCDVTLVNEDDVIQFEQSRKHNDVAYVLYTSGSTGTPKGVEVTHEALENFIEGVSAVIDFSPNKRIACLTNISFDIFFLESIMALEKGLSVILADEYEQKNPKLMAKLISDNRVDMIQMTPSRMQLLINCDPELKCLTNVKEIMLGGEALPLTMLKILQEKTCARIYNMYGPTETTVWSTISDLTCKDQVDIGTPIINTQIYIVDSDMNIVPDGEKGEICIAGKGLAKGYVGQVGLTNEKFVYLPQHSTVKVYRTGDYGRYLTNGALECLGRMDYQIKIRGHRIELEEIEYNITQFDGIIQSIVVATNVGESEYKLEAFFTSSNDVDIEKLREFLQLKIPNYMIPTFYKRVESFVFTSNGKIDRKRLKEYSEYFDDHPSEVTSGEQILTDFQRGILDIIVSNIEDKSIFIGPKTNLSVTGVDSITFIKIVVSLEVAYGIEFSDEKILMSEFPTVKTLIEYVESEIGSHM